MGQQIFPDMTWTFRWYRRYPLIVTLNYDYFNGILASETTHENRMSIYLIFAKLQVRIYWGHWIAPKILNHPGELTNSPWYWCHKYFAFRCTLIILHLSCMLKNVTRTVYNARENVSATRLAGYQAEFEITIVIRQGVYYKHYSKLNL